MRKLLLVGFLTFLSFSTYAQSEKKIYETDDFTVQYPASWNLETKLDAPLVFVVKALPTSDEDTFAENVNLITQNLKGANLSLDNYVKLNRDQLATLSNSELISNLTDKRGARNYHTLIFSADINNMELKLIQLYTIKNEVAYILTFTSLRNEFSQLEEVGKQIIKSFKLKEE